MKPQTQAVLLRIKENFDKTSDAVAKADLYAIVEALAELFVDEEPRLVDPNVDEDLKGAMFFKALLNIGLGGGEAIAQKKYIPEEDWETKLPFIAKMKKFMKLEDVLIRYSQNV